MRSYHWHEGQFKADHPFDGLNRGFLYADGCFDTSLFYEGSLVFWELRLARLRQTFRYLGLEEIADWDLLHRSACEVITSHGSHLQRVRLTFYRAGGGKYLPENDRVEIVMMTEDADRSKFNSTRLRSVDVSQNYLASGSGQSHKLLAKHEHVIAAREARRRGLDDLILVNQAGELAETINGNVFVVFGDEVLTPTLESGCLAGITRSVLLEHPSVHEASIRLDHVKHADALFTANSIAGVSALQWRSQVNVTGAVERYQQYLAERMQWV